MEKTEGLKTVSVEAASTAGSAVLSNAAVASAGKESDGNSHKVVARVHQGFDVSINIRVVPGNDFRIPEAALICRPRQGATRRNAEPLELPEPIIRKFKLANKKMVAWLSQSAANTKLFLSSPMEAMAKAGIELTRAEQKTLARTHSIVGESYRVAPGVKIEKLDVVARKSGRVTGVQAKPKAAQLKSTDCRCGSNGKE